MRTTLPCMLVNQMWVFFETVYQRSLQVLATEMYMILNGISPDIMQDIFKIKSNYCNTCNVPAFFSGNIKIVRQGLHTSSYMTPKIWDFVPKEIKQVTILNKCKTNRGIARTWNKNPKNFMKVFGVDVIVDILDNDVIQGN